MDEGGGERYSCNSVNGVGGKSEWPEKLRQATKMPRRPKKKQKKKQKRPLDECMKGGGRYAEITKKGQNNEIRNEKTKSPAKKKGGRSH